MMIKLAPIAALVLALSVTSLALAQQPSAPVAPRPKTAIAPPLPTRDPDAPPEGRGAGGLDFGAWRTAQPLAVSGAFVQETARLAEGGDLRAALVANGFRCGAPESGDARWICGRSALEGACGYDWIVEQGGAPAAAARARFERHCLPAGRRKP